MAFNCIMVQCGGIVIAQRGIMAKLTTCIFTGGPYTLLHLIYTFTLLQFYTYTLIHFNTHTLIHFYTAAYIYSVSYMDASTYCPSPSVGVVGHSNVINLQLLKTWQKTTKLTHVVDYDIVNECIQLKNFLHTELPLPLYGCGWPQ